MNTRQYMEEVFCIMWHQNSDCVSLSFNVQIAIALAFTEWQLSQMPDVPVYMAR